VIGTGGPAQQDRLRELGAIAIDYRHENLPGNPRVPTGKIVLVPHET